MYFDGHTQSFGFSSMAIKRPRPVVESEAAAGRHAQHIRAISPAIGCYAHRSFCTVICDLPVCELCKSSGEGQVSVGDDGSAEALMPQMLHPLSYSRVQPHPRPHDRLRPQALRPTRHLSIIADNENLERRSRRHHMSGHRTSQIRPLRRRKLRREPLLGF